MGHFLFDLQQFDLRASRWFVEFVRNRTDHLGELLLTKHNLWTREVSLKLAIMLSFMFLQGCSALSKKTSSANFRDRAKIELQGTAFYQGKRRDGRENCFPPAVYPVCGEMASKDEYSPIEKLDMEGFRISISDDSGIFDSSVYELMLIIAGELATQRGFSKFIVDEVYYKSGCRTSYDANTIGSRTNYGFRSTTTLSERSTCSGYLSIGLLIFKRYEQIEAGVFHFDRYSPEVLQPYYSLYYTNRDRLKLMKEDPDYWQLTLRSPVQAWKSYYDAIETSSQLREKHRVEPYSNYQVVLPTKSAPSLIESLKRTR